MENDERTIAPWGYLAVLFGRGGEYEALAHLRPAQRVGLATMLVLRGGTKAPDDAAALAQALDRMRTSWDPQGPVILDGERLNSPDLFAGCLEAAHAKGWLAIPSTRLADPPAYGSVVRDSARTGAGAVVRLGRLDLGLPEADLNERLQDLLGRMALEPENVDLVIDLRQIEWLHSAALSHSVLNTVRRLPCVARWRHLAVACSGMPETLRLFPPDAITSVPRAEVALYDGVYSSRHLMPRLPVYGDYGVGNPDQADELASGAGGNTSASLRYTTDQAVLIVKGQPVGTGGIERFPVLLARLVASGAFAGETFSDGDRRIKAASSGGATGNLTHWRSWATSHHIAVVSEQIASSYGL